VETRAASDGRASFMESAERPRPDIAEPWIAIKPTLAWGRGLRQVTVDRAGERGSQGGELPIVEVAGDYRRALVAGGEQDSRGQGGGEEGFVGTFSAPRVEVGAPALEIGLQSPIDPLPETFVVR